MANFQTNMTVMDWYWFHSHAPPRDPRKGHI